MDCKITWRYRLQIWHGDKIWEKICNFEGSVPKHLWDGALTKRDSKDIESVQKICVKLISGQHLINYEESLKSLGLETLALRRVKLCFKFARKCLKNNRFNHWFKLKNRVTRSDDKYLVPTSKTKRFLSSSIPHLTRILNKFSWSKSKSICTYYENIVIMYILCYARLLCNSLDDRRWCWVIYVEWTLFSSIASFSYQL